MTIGIALMTQLRSDTSLPVFWLWMFITGVGIGPTLSVFTIVVQNAVPFNKLGVATSNLTFFRQIGGTIALAFVGTSCRRSSARSSARSRRPRRRPSRASSTSSRRAGRPGSTSTT